MYNTRFVIKVSVPAVPLTQGFLSKITTTDPYLGVTTTEFDRNPLGQVTLERDVENGNVQQYSYDGYGRELSHSVNGTRTA